MELIKINFQQGGASHNTTIVTNCLAANFSNNWIANQEPNVWPARSTDLMLIDFYLWGRLEDLIFKLLTNSRYQLEAAVIQVLSLTPIQLIHSANVYIYSLFVLYQYYCCCCCFTVYIFTSFLRLLVLLSIFDS